MKILFDHGTPAPLRDHLAGHEVSTAYEMRWATLRNGDLLTAAEKEFGAFLTTDKNLRYQQNLTGRHCHPSAAHHQLAATPKAYAGNHCSGECAQPGDYIELNFDAQS